ncbi:MAG: hypothetical protein IPG72_07205 [Ardenticatenales bacterium]|nr:hypothetical protein [Ardenticatenales bacterium]
MSTRQTYLSGLPALASPDQHLADHSTTPAMPTAADAVTVSATFAGADAPVGVEVRYRVRGGAGLRVAMARAGAGRAVRTPHGPRRCPRSGPAAA